MIEAAQRWAASLFPPDPVPDPPRPTSGLARRAGIIAAYLAGIAAVAAVSLARQPGVPLMNSVWAEDGVIFLGDIHRHSFGYTIFSPYNGYLHVVPRLIAGLVSLFPIHDAALVFAVASALVLGIASMFVFRASAGHLRSPIVRGVLAASFALLPVAGFEMFGNVSNLHWFLFVAALAALLWRPHSLWGTAAACAMTFAATTSDPQTAVLLPVVALRLLGLWQNPLRAAWWRDHAASIAWGAGMLVQAWAIVHDHTPPTPYGRGPIDELVSSYGIRVLLSSLTGGQLTETLFHHYGRYATISAALVLGVAAVLLVRRTGARGLLLLVIAHATALTMFALAFELRWSPSLTATEPDLLHSGSRYSIAPLILVLVPVLALIDLVLRSRRTIARAGALAVLAAIVCLWGIDFRGPNYREVGPKWSTTVATARATCRRTRAPVVVVPVAPSPFAAELPCAELLQP